MYPSVGKLGSNARSVLLGTTMLAGLTTAVLGTAPAFAQDAMETVVVTGIRASLQSAQAIKQNSDQVVDSITAVDIGALPDNSVAEALQRVPGIQISRTDQPNDPLRWASNGNGVFIRGLSWVKSLTNGEEIFGAENGRTISFADISPDLMAGVDVYKNPNAKMIEGGVGGTVNLKTRMPFDFEGLKIAGSGTASYGTLSPQTGMEGNVLVSDRFSTGKLGEIGVLLSASYQNLVNGNNIVTTDPWTQTQRTGPWTNSTDNYPPFQTNQYYPRGLTKAFGMLGYRHMDWKQPRTSLDATVQWRPTETLEITFVGLYAKAEPQSQEHNVAWIIPVTNSQYCGQHMDGSAAMTGGTCDYPIGSLSTLQASDPASASASMASYGYDANGYLNKGTIFNAQSDSTYVNYFDTRYDVRHHTNKNAELTFKWTPNNNLSVSLDTSYIDSRATMSSMTMYYGTKSDRYMQAANYSGHAQFYPNAPHIDVSFDLTDGSPKITYNTAGATALGTQSEYLWAAAMDHYENNYAHAYTTRADATYTFNGKGLFGWVKSVEAGVRTDLKSSDTRNTGWNWGRIGFTTWNALNCGRRSDYGGNFLDPVTACATPMGDLSTQMPGNTEAYKFPTLFGTAMPSIWEPSMSWMKQPYKVWSDLQPVIASYRALKWPYNSDGTLATGYSTAADSFWTPATMRDGNCSGVPYLCNNVYTRGTVNSQREDTLAAYFMLDFAHDTFLGMEVPVDGNIGVRIVNTQYNSGPGQLRLPNVTDCGTAAAGSDRAHACTFLGADNNTTTTYAGISNHYTNVLPSFNFRAGLTETLQLRLAYSQGMVRPELERMRNYTQLGYAFGALTAHDQFAASNALTGSGSNPYLKPTYSQNYDASLEWYFAPTGNVALALFHKTIGNYVMSGVAPMSFTRNGITQTFNVGSYVNGSKGTVEGFEFSYQQFYDSLPGALSGLGTQFNYTKIYNSGGANPVAAIYNPINGVNVYANINGTDFTPGALGYAGDTRLPMEGMSNDSFNAALMYEKYGISGRIAYNWRSRNLVNSYPANIFQPVFQRSYGQLDASFLYTFLEHYKVGVQANNLLKQTSILEVGQTVATKHIYQWVEGERKFSLVLRATW